MVALALGCDPPAEPVSPTAASPAPAVTPSTIPTPSVSSTPTPTLAAPQPPTAEQIVQGWRDAVVRTDRGGVEQYRRPLYGLRDEDVVPLLTKQAVEDANPRARAWAVGELGRRRRPELFDFFRERLVDDCEPVRENAVRALGDLGDSAARADLERVASQDPSEAVRAAAQGALARLRP